MHGRSFLLLLPAALVGGATLLGGCAMLLGGCAVLLGGCAGGGISRDTSTGMLTGDRGTRSVPIPGDVRRAGREGIQRTPQTVLTPEEIAARRARSLQTAETLWQRAEAAEAGNPEAAGDLYREIAENHPQSPRAAEAKFREGRAYVRAGEYRDGVDALKRYMDIAPANPNLAEVERLAFDAGRRYLAGIRGLQGVFMSSSVGYEMLAFVPRTFPNGALADDALVELARAYTREDDKESWILAAQQYKLLLRVYPESELRPEAWLGLGHVYLRRDQGARWHAGFVDHDPTERVPDDPKAQAFAGPVESAPRLALEAYEALLEEADRGVVPVSAAQRQAAHEGIRTAKDRLAAKEERVARAYGGGLAADPYLRSAARLRGQPEPPPRAPLGIPPAGTPPPQPARAQPSVPQPTPPQPTPPQPTPPQPTPPQPAPPQPTPPQPGRPPPSVPPPTPPQPTVPTPGPDPFQPPAVQNPPALPSALPPPTVRRTTSGAR